MTVQPFGQSPTPSWLEESPEGDRPGLIRTRPQSLPFDQLTAANFERLVLRLVRLDTEVEHAQQYGLPGEDQHGIDLYCRLSRATGSGRRYRTVQCRNVATATASELALAVEDFLEGSWARRTDVYVFAMRAETIRAGRAEAVETAADRLRQANVRFELWDGAMLSAWLKELPELVEQFFGPDAARAFCNQDSANLISSRQVLHVQSDVRTASAFDLGVHRSVEAAINGPELTEYVYRTHDDQLRSLLSSERRRCQPIVLVGGSSTGKTRSAFEAIQSIFPDWAIFHPANADDIKRFSRVPVRNCILWLDELQTYIDGDEQITANMLDTLHHNAAGRIVVIATLWASKFQSYVELPAGESDPYRTAREFLRQAEIVDVAADLDADEIRRANDAASRDPRIGIALGSTDYGMTQVLAAAPHLVRRWANAPDLYSKALITAAFDAQTAGCQPPLSAVLLKSLVPHYLQAPDRARASSDWLDKALRYAVQPLHGSASALSPVAEQMGEATGYVIADFLLQHGEILRRNQRPPSDTWHEYISHTRDGRSLLLLGFRAELHGLHEIAEIAFAKSESLGNADARYQLIKIAEEAGRYRETEGYLRKGLVEGDQNALLRLTDFVQSRHGITAAIDFLRTQQQTDINVCSLLSRLLEQTGEIDAAVAVWHSIDLNAIVLPGVRVAEILQRNGRLDEAADTWLTVARAGAVHGWARAAGIYSQQNRVEDLEQLWSEALDRRIPGALGRLIRLLQVQRKASEVNDVLARATSTGVQGAASWLATISADLGRHHEVEQTLRAGMEAGDAVAQRDLILFLRTDGREAEATDLASRIPAQDRRVERWSRVDRLRRTGRLDDAIAACRDAISDGDYDLYWPLIDVLEQAGRSAEAIASLERSATSNPAFHSYVAAIHRRQGAFEAAIVALRAAMAGNYISAWEDLAWMISEHGSSLELEEVLHTASNAGQRSATLWLAEHLIYDERQHEVRPLFERSSSAEQDHIIMLFEESGDTSTVESFLTQSISYSDRRARSQLSGILERQGRIQEAVSLWRKDANDDPEARNQLADLLEDQGRLDEAGEIRRIAIDLGDDDADERATRFSIRHNRTEELFATLREAVTRGIPGAHTRLAATLQRYGRRDEAAEAWRGAIAAGEPLARHLGPLSSNKFDDRVSKTYAEADPPA